MTFLKFYTDFGRHLLLSLLPKMSFACRQLHAKLYRAAEAQWLKLWDTDQKIGGQTPALPSCHCCAVEQSLPLTLSAAGAL